jgi:ferritin
MISPKLTKLLNAQIGHEFAASQQYLAMAVYFAQQSLDKLAKFFYDQSEEEREHALKIVRFLVDVGAEFNFPAVSEANPKFKSAPDVAKAALKYEQKVTAQFHKMAETALSEKDFTTFQFLQWFLEEQVEEEATMGKLVDLLSSGANLFIAETLLPAD